MTTGTIGTTTSAQSTADALNNDAVFRTSFAASVDSTTGQLKVTSLNGEPERGHGHHDRVRRHGRCRHRRLGTGGGFSASDLGITAVNLSTQTGANTAIDLIDTAIKTVSTSRANLGALQNRFEHTINNLNVTAENLTASESRIRDTDMAQEMTNFSRTQILSQAGTSMLAQANQASQSILKLLG